MARAGLLAVQLGMLGAMAWAAWAGPLQGPVFSVAARAEAPGKTDWHVGGVHTPYLVKTYEMAQARAWLDLGQDSEDPEVRAEAAARARDHAQRAIAAVPTNGYAWGALGWAETLAGDREAALAAVERARDWTPAAPNLALDRALIAQAWWPELDAETRTEVLDDVWLASQGYGRRFREALAASPRLGVLLEIARAGREEG
ncbi:MAG: hypothetical protein AAGF79_17495 [Pseudomonadota bacterium]